MRSIETFKVAIGGLKGNPLRSFLTILGVVIGVTAVIVMVAIGEGAKQQVSSRIQGLGSNLLIISPGRGGNRSTGFGSFGSGTAINNDLVDYLRPLCTLCKEIAPESSSNLAVKGPLTSVQTSVVGVTPEYESVRDYHVSSGSFVTQADMDERNRVALLGSSVAQELFGEDDPIGRTVKIGAVQFTVTGVLASKGQSGFMNIDDQVLVPLSTAQRRLWRNERLRSIYVEAVSAKAMNDAQAELEELLLEHLKNPDSFVVNNQAEILSTMESTTGTFTLLLAGIAGVSLLVGGIGIMNIMLVSVTERIREIGVRKALGARRQEIMGQFLCEAIILSMLGGLIGIFLGITGSLLVGKYAGWGTAISVESIILAFGYSLCVGLFFGVYPASKASRLQPVIALRTE